MPMGGELLARLSMHPAARSIVLVALLSVGAAARALDAFGDGLSPAREQALMQRFAPVVLLAPGERAKPANVNWYLARATLEQKQDPVPASRGPGRKLLATTLTQASLLGDWLAVLQERQGSTAVLRPSLDTRPGSDDPRDWVAYGHAYPAQDGGTLLQYWFFYPFNDGHLFFDHEADWEHVTVRLDRAERPLGAYFARHREIAPGRWYPWERLACEGEHPVVLSARGTHASYPSASEVPWFDATCKTRDPAQAETQGCRVWRTANGAGAGGVLDTGQRFRPRPEATFLSWPGRWGARGPMGLEGDGAPLGPAFQKSWCSLAGPGCN
jgi:hypothetical protein